MAHTVSQSWNSNLKDSFHCGSNCHILVFVATSCVTSGKSHHLSEPCLVSNGRLEQGREYQVLSAEPGT